MPTVLELCGLDIPDFVQGKSLVPIFVGNDDNAELRPFAVSAPTLSTPELEVPHPTNRATFTNREWILVTGAYVEKAKLETTKMVDSRQRKISTIYGSIGPELYDLSTDPWCKRNVLEDHKEVARQMRSEFLQFLKTTDMREDHLPYFEAVPPEML